MKWLGKEPWCDAFADVLERHIGQDLHEHDVSDFDELGGLIGADWVMTLWGCAFEDFLTRDVEDAGNIVDDYLKRRGWNESARNKAYMAGLRDSVMSLYEVSDIQPGRSFLARDLVRGGEPVRVSERTATETLKLWDRIAMRIVDVRGAAIIGGGLLPFEHELSERLIDLIGSIENQGAADIAATVGELGIDRNDPEFDRMIAAATNKTEFLRYLAPAFSIYFLSDLLDRMAEPILPQMTNSDGDDMEFMRLFYRLTDGATAVKVRAALNQAPELDAASKTFWNWLEPEQANKKNRKAKTGRTLEHVTTMGDGSVVLGTIELKSRTIELCVNSETRADRGRKMLEPLLDDLVSPPLVERQTLEQAFAEQLEDGPGSPVPELSADEQLRIVHETLDRHYRDQLDQPVPALGNVSPRRAAKTKKGREKLVDWLKRLENRTAEHDPEDPMASYDVTWMWKELGVSDLRN